MEAVETVELKTGKLLEGRIGDRARERLKPLLFRLDHVIGVSCVGEPIRDNAADVNSFGNSHDGIEGDVGYLVSLPCVYPNREGG